MRTFIAIEFTSTIHQQLAEIIERVQSALQQQHLAAALRWVDPQNSHLTLRFLGDTSPDQLQALSRGLAAVATNHRPFELTIGDIGGFPNLRQPRVLWLGVGGALPQLNALQEAVEQAVQVVGFATEKRPFSAHVTLARAQRSASQTQLRTVGTVLQACAITQQLHLQVKAVVHMQSELRAGGAVYRQLNCFPLA
ncbi:MAG: RNA 2',3'-cyclic phosphodiesterase [Caldilineaceae bacterium]|nr:RNA 2',3'-cyclic phosphodiesterase [Caldilineaceae bacterium]